MQTMDTGTSKSSLDQASEQTDLPDLASRFSCPSSKVLGKCELHLEPSCQANLFIKDNCSVCRCVWLSEKEPACNAGATGDSGSVPGLRRSPGGWHGNPLQYSCLENPMDRGAWRATVHSPQGCKELDMTEVTQNTHAKFLHINTQ